MKERAEQLQNDIADLVYEYTIEIDITEPGELKSKINSVIQSIQRRGKECLG